MRYHVRQMVVSHVPELEIGLEQFEALRNARVVLKDSFALEEVWELLILNYQELEKRTLEAGVENAVRNISTYEEFFRLRCSLSVCLVNVLTTAKMFLHQAVQLLPTDGKVTFENTTKKFYDASFNYRFMEALRNYVQHCGLPVHLVTHGAQKKEAEDGTSRIEFTTSPQAIKSRLAEDGVFKATVLKEMPDAVDLMPCVRSYLESLSELQALAREQLGPQAAAARAINETAREAYLSKPGAGPIGVSAIARSDKGEIVEELSLTLDWDDVRKSQMRRNRPLTRISKHYVSGIPKS